jgi:WD40 repeat protein
MAYDAFISYSHAADGRLAPALQSGLQRLAKPWYRLRALRVFRDETGLATNPQLWSSIEAALDESEWFVLLASPESATSPWVEKEIAHWSETKSAGRILPVVTGGEWEWDSGGGCLVGSAVPEVLRSALTEEPRHLDLRWAASATDLDLRNGEFRSAIADLAAPMHGIAKDDLVGEDIRQHRRARRLARAGVTAVVLLLIVSVIFGGYAINQRNRADRRRDEARAATAAARQQLLVSESQAHLSSDRQLATLLAIEADRRKPSADTRDALLNAVLAEPRLQRSFAGPISAMGAVVDHRVVLLRADRGRTPNRDVVQVWDWQTGRRQPWPQAPAADANSGPVGLATTADGLLLAVVSRAGMIQLYSGRTLQPEGVPLSSGLGPAESPSTVSFSANDQTLAVSGAGLSSAPYANPSISVFSRRTNGWVRDPSPGGHHTRVNTFDLSADGRVLVTASLTPAGDVSAGSDLVISAVATGQTLQAFRGIATVSVALDWARRRVVASQQNIGSGDAVWYDLNHANPAPQVIDQGLSPAGYARIGYDAARARLAIFGNVGFGISDGTTLTPLAKTPPLRPNNTGNAFLFLDADHILLGASFGPGPVTLWDLAGTSVLATRVSPRFDVGIAPTDDPHRFLGYAGTSRSSGVTGTTRTLMVLGPDYRPIGAPLPVESGSTACVDDRIDRIATISPSSGDVLIRATTPPFRVLSRAPGATRRLADLITCHWRPDGRQIVLGTYPRTRQQNRRVSVALYDVARKTVHEEPLPELVAVLSLVYSADSKTLLVGGPNIGSSGVYQISDLDQHPRVTVAFPGATAIDTDSADHRLIVASPESVRVFDATTRKALTPPIDLPGSGIFSVSSSPDGHTAAVVGPQGWRLVDLDAQQPTGPTFPLGGIGTAILGTDGTTVYSQGAAGKFIWNLAPAHLQDAACDLAGRNLTAPEWQKYLTWAGPHRATCPQYPLN